MWPRRPGYLKAIGALQPPASALHLDHSMIWRFSARQLRVSAGLIDFAPGMGTDSPAGPQNRHDDDRALQAAATSHPADHLRNSAHLLTNCSVRQCPCGGLVLRRAPACRDLVRRRLPDGGVAGSSRGSPRAFRSGRPLSRKIRVPVRILGRSLRLHVGRRWRLHRHGLPLRGLPPALFSSALPDFPKHLNQGKKQKDEDEEPCFN